MAVVDEFHTIPADHEGFTPALDKFSGHVALGTQGLRRPDVLDRVLQPVVSSNVDPPPLESRTQAPRKSPLC